MYVRWNKDTNRFDFSFPEGQSVSLSEIDTRLLRADLGNALSVKDVSVPSGRATIVLPLPLFQAELLVAKNDRTASFLHVTLLAVDNVPAVDHDRLRDIVSEWASHHPPVVGMVGYGFADPEVEQARRIAIHGASNKSTRLCIRKCGMFIRSHNLKVDSDEIVAMQSDLTVLLARNGFVRNDHGFTPHVSVRAGSCKKIRPDSIVFGNIAVWIGDDHRNYPMRST